VKSALVAKRFVEVLLVEDEFTVTEFVLVLLVEIIPWKLPFNTPKLVV
jgi:ATP-dependent Clp protease adapter protein ClpS